MADDDQDDSQKTEDPTHKRLEDAVKKGQVVFSREVTSFLMLFILALMIGNLLPHMMRKIAGEMTGFISNSSDYHIDSGNIMTLSIEVVKGFFGVMLFPLMFLILAAFFSALAQHGWIISAESLKPQISRVSPLSGLGKLFSARSLIEFLKGIAKISLIGVIAYTAVEPALPEFEQLYTHSALGVMIFLGKLSLRIMIGVCVFMFFVAVLDFIYQRYEYMKNMRMSKQEIKEEFKQTEGNPEVRSKLREIRRARANKRMMAAVPEADAVITNPTHYSVALKYDADSGAAPIVVAKGQDHVALKIREIARENDVPIVENPPLARALFASVEIDEEIPVTHYNAVAEVIRYVYKLKGKL